MRRILVFTGPGKGKTSAALGVVLRAAGHGRRSLIVQFLKSAGRTGELESCRYLPGVDIVPRGLGFLPERGSSLWELHRKAAEEALAYAESALASDRYDCLVLDEVCGALAHGLLDAASVLHSLRGGTKASCVILTGRGAPAEIIEAADTVTEMRCVRHALERGIPAEEGVEY